MLQRRSNVTCRERASSSATRPDLAAMGFSVQLTLAGHDCVVVAPSLIPRRSRGSDQDRPAGCDQPRQTASRRRTDRCLGSGSGSRGDPRSRYAHVLRPSAVCVQARQQLSGFLLRHGSSLQSADVDIDVHRRWMAGLRFEQAAHHIVLEDCIAAVEWRRCDATVWKSYRGGAAGLVACPGGARPASAARNGSGRGGDGDRRTR